MHYDVEENTFSQILAPRRVLQQPTGPGRAARATPEGADKCITYRGARSCGHARFDVSRFGVRVALVLASLSSASPAPASLRVAFDASTGDVDAHATPRLAALSRAFDTNPAFEVVSRSSPPSDASTPTADIVWETVPGAIPSALRSGQRANHFPGIGAFASKSALAHLASSPGRAPVTLTNTPPRTRSPARFATLATSPTRGSSSDPTTAG